MKKKEREIGLEILMAYSENYFSKTIYLEKMEEYGYLTPSQKAFIKRLVQGVIERQYSLDYIIRSHSSLRLKKIQPVVLMILRLSVYQLFYMDKVPDYSVVDEGVKLVKKFRQFQAVAFTNAVLHQVIRNRDRMVLDMKKMEDDGPWDLAYSFPQDCIDILGADYPPATLKKMLSQSLMEKPQSLRLILSSPEAKQEVDKFLRTNADRILGGGLLFDNVCKYYGNIQDQVAFQKGYLQVQDEASMLVGYLASQDQPQTIYDLCAAPGGKTSHIASLLPNSQVMAFDLTPEKIDKILENKARLGLQNVEVKLADASLFDPQKVQAADCVLADVPCSGLGVISSKPEIKYRIKRQVIDHLCRIQSQILDQAAKYVKPGGSLFYSTCTITAAENQNMIDQFLQSHPEFFLGPINLDPIFQSPRARQMEKEGELIWHREMLQILPQSLQGFFIAKLRKTL